MAFFRNTMYNTCKDKCTLTISFIVIKYNIDSSLTKLLNFCIDRIYGKKHFV